MIARNTDADVNVIALIGERGREVREFIENDLGEEGLSRSVVIVSTSDTPPLSRLRGAYVASAVAEYFRDQGKDVMLLFDSVTRFARAQREVGLAIGEPPATRGYTPSVFDSMPKLLERSGTSDKGSITGVYTILVDGDDMDEPVADTVRGILDGHIVLSRRLAQRYQYPAVDVLKSVSRLVGSVTGPITQKVMGYVRKVMAVYEENEDMITIGAYVKGSEPRGRRGHREAGGRRGIPHPGGRGKGADSRYDQATVRRSRAYPCPPRRSRPTPREAKGGFLAGPRRGRTARPSVDWRRLRRRGRSSRDGAARRPAKREGPA